MAANAAALLAQIGGAHALERVLVELERRESCGGHFRAEHQTEEGEAKRDDERFAYAAVWEFTGVGSAPVLHKEPLQFEYVHLAQRSYK